MKSVLVSVTALLLLINCYIEAQQVFTTGADLYHIRKSLPGNSSGTKISNTYSSNHSFDVLDYKIYLDIYNCFSSPFPKSFIAYEFVKFRADSVLNSIKLNADSGSLIIDSVKLSGISFTHVNNVLKINLDRVYYQGEIGNVQIYFRHKNVFDTAFFNFSGNVLTDCEPFGARKWFPCWDQPNDKATLDITAKVPLLVKLGSNGRLNDSTINGDTIYYHWISRDPIVTYAIAIIARPYINLDIIYWHKLSNPNDSIPIRFYWNYGEVYDSISHIMNIILPMTDFYSTIFTEHPFEKNGFASSGQLSWGMENQTLTFLSNTWNENQVSHEFAHQWFGDMITCGTWADIWLNEGFASYCEALWIEHNSGYQSYKSHINDFASFYFTYPTNLPIYNPSWITNPPPKWQLLSNSLSYCKPACVLHMLRYTIGDSIFFNVLKSYASDTTYMFKNAVTADFISKVNQVSQQNYDWFFDEWIFKPNHPKYQNNYNIVQIDSTNWKIDFTINQVQSNPPFFKMPVEIKFFMGFQDTIVTKVMNDINHQLFEFTFNRRPYAAIFDPYKNIVLKEATTTIGIENISSENPVKYNLYQNYPNPFNSTTVFMFDIAKSGITKMVLYDILGKETLVLVNKMLNEGRYKISFNAESFASGVYFYRIESGTFTASKKFVLLK